MKNLKFPIGIFTEPVSITAIDLKTWISVIENFPNRIKSLTKNLSVEELNWVYRPEGWSIKQVVHHCADSHMNSLIRFKLALTEDLPIIKPYEEAFWAILADVNSDDLKASLQIIEGVHTRWTLLLKSFTDIDFARKFIHPASGKIFRLDEALGLYAWHCNHHFAHIEQALFYKNEFEKI
jgi:DinB superfamily